MKVKETEVAKPVVEWFESQGWTVYQEVQPDREGPIADIVATKGSLTWIVEVKTSRSLTLLDQALGWMGDANLVSVATPAPKRLAQFRAVSWERVCEQLGLGYFQVGEHTVYCRRFPRLNRRLLGTEGIRSALRDEHRTWAEAGNNAGSRWTPFGGLVSELKVAAGKRPGTRLDEFIDETPHHYSNDKCAVATLKRHIRDGVIPGLVCRQGKVYPKGFNRHTMRKVLES